MFDLRIWKRDKNGASSSKRARNGAVGKITDSVTPNKVAYFFWVDLAF